MQALVKSEIDEDSAALHDYVQVKIERPDCEIEVELKDELYLDHEIKEELVIGPEVLQKPGPSAELAFRGAERPRLEIKNEKIEEENPQIHSKNISGLYYNCTECDYTTVTQNGLDKHWRFHDKRRQYVCDTCSFRFETKVLLNNHVKCRHTDTETYMCKICDKFKTNKLGFFEDHLRGHTGEKTFSCPRCEYKCNQQTAFEKHIGTHTRKKSFCCPHCHYKFTTRCCLKRHIRTHTGERPYSCPQCQYTSIQKGAMTSHMKIHTGEKPFPCPQCELKCTRQCDLKRHISRKHKIVH